MFNKKVRKRLFNRLAKRPLKQRVKTWMLTSMLIGGLARLRSKARFIPGLRARRRKQPINAAYGLCAAASAGAGLMYLLDPNQGGLRRSSLTGGASRAAHNTGSAIGGASRDLFNLARGLVSGAESRFGSDDTGDRSVIKLIRSEIGRLVSHPRAIQIAAHDGRVAITGHILARELDDLITRIRSLRGVIEVDNRLHTHERDEDIHHHHRLGGHLSGFSPIARTLTALAGGALLGAGLRRRGVLGAGLGAIGVGLVARGLTNIGVKRLIGGRHAIDFHKTINLNAPIERVFEFWANHDNFPHFLSNVREVRRAGDGRLQWTAFGPAGAPVKWDARITEFIPNKLIAWKSEPGSAIAHAGIVRLDTNRDGSTRAAIKMSFHPQAGEVGEAIEAIFGENPKREIEEGLHRVKAIIETGRAARSAARTWSSMREATAD